MGGEALPPPDPIEASEAEGKKPDKKKPSYARIEVKESPREKAEKELKTMAIKRQRDHQTKMTAISEKYEGKNSVEEIKERIKEEIALQSKIEAEFNQLLDDNPEMRKLVQHVIIGGYIETYTVNEDGDVRTTDYDLIFGKKDKNSPVTASIRHAVVISDNPAYTATGAPPE